MTKLPCVLLACMSLLTVNAKPSQNIIADTTTLQDIKHVASLASADDLRADTDQSPRQKRGFNFYDFPPIPNQARDSFEQQEDTVLEIYRKLKDISSIVRNPTVQAPPQFIPVYIPVLFVPVPCSCGGQNGQNGGANGTTQSGTENVTTQSGKDNVTTQSPPRNDTTPMFSITDNEDDDDTIMRPISFKPIQPDEPSNRPAPPVERGNALGGAK
ncbi:uncharacterized protein LOC125488945 [Plutella xylostella]|uniref:uncharacterized protein LOC125488945 n=1 Tax=Plutella xylostella TaxID=51655 RepID=UPI0020327C8A|nr:uncharacterized protein LOC125488945 [Plutella xylostella]